MRRMYRRLVERRAFLVKRARVAIAEIDAQEYIVGSVGLATFFFGFYAGAMVNLVLLAIDHPLVLQFRSSLSYTSAILGDGILLPIINMIAVSFILRNREFVGRKTIQAALIAGIAITAWFHINQAMQGIVNWAMPAPWQWNILGIWHAIYMFSVASLLSLFYITVVKYIREEREIPKGVVLVTFGLILFFMLLRLDYIDITYSTLVFWR